MVVMIRLSGRVHACSNARPVMTLVSMSGNEAISWRFLGIERYRELRNAGRSWNEWECDGKKSQWMEERLVSALHVRGI